MEIHLLILGLTVSMVAGDPSWMRLNGSRPIIEPSGPLIMKPGETLRLKCSGSGSSSPLAWDWDSDSEDPRLEIETTEGSSVLTLQNLTYLDRNTFVCFYDTHNSIPGFGESAVDVYIDDPEHLLVLPPGQEIRVANVNKGMRGVVPFCRVTHPDVHVELTHTGKSVLEEPSWTYTKEGGFVVDPVVAHTHDLYDCIATRGDKTERFNVFLVVVVAAGLLPHPNINSTLAQSVRVGSTFTLSCTFQSDPQDYYLLTWTEPKDIINSSRAKVNLTELSSNHYKRFRSELVVMDARKEDAEKIYICTAQARGVNYSANDTVSIFAAGEEFLEVRASKERNITVNASTEDAVWIIDIFGFPRPDTFTWKNPKGFDIDTGPKSRHSMVYHKDKNQVFLAINSVGMHDNGRYVFEAANTFETSSLELYLTVRDAPEVTLDTNGTFFSVNKNYIFQCKAVGYPYPEIEWSFQKCDALDLSEEKCGEFQYFHATHDLIFDSKVPRSSIQKTAFNIQGTGFIRCIANNSLGIHEVETLVVAVDFLGSQKKGFGIHGSFGEPNLEPIENESETYYCSASKLNYTDDIRWYYQSNSKTKELRVDELEGVTLFDNSTKWSYVKEMKIENLKISSSGVYRCEVVPLEGASATLSSRITVNVRRMEASRIFETNLNKTKIITGSTWTIGKLYCNATGVPKPRITWYKDGELIDFIPKLQDEVIIGSNYIDFKGLSSEYNGRYSCRATNQLGVDEKYIDIEVKHEKDWILLIIIITLAVLLSICGTIALAQHHKEQKMKRWLKKLHLEDFENGDIEKINPEEGLEGQINYLPYDKKLFEFPRERLKLGMRIGSGAFGQVVLAEALGIKEGEAKTTVAVKMVKPNSDEIHFKALMSELKIMIHLGTHVNVVNVLGACTKQLCKKRELLVIVEYCQFGSLLSYLHRHNKDFVDQLDRSLDIVDPNVCYPVERLCQSPSHSGNYGESRGATANGYHTMQELQIDPMEGDMRRRVSDYALSTHVQSVCTDMSYVSNAPTVLGTDGRKRSSSSSTWNGHYRGVYQYRDVRPITTTDLLCWSFQISRGMEYITSRKVLHGDLAARNVLLASDNTVKICDFGLAREMFEEKYRKKTEVPLPIKWMAPESIYYRVFSTQSDVWSFGVVMWEIFTLGKDPYPAMEPEQFYQHLSRGGRMERPSYAPSSIYDLMCACWDKEPSSRPNFTAIVDRIGNLMDDSLRKHYMDLNVPYLDENQRRMEGKEDYLEKMCGPDYNSVSKRPTPDRSYTNLEQPNSDYLIPNSFHSHHLQIPGIHHQYNEPQLTSLANNAGYVFMNRNSSGSQDIVYNPNEYQNSSPIEEEKAEPTTLAISNINYVPNTIFLKNQYPGLQVTDNDVENEEDVNVKRHKNDSGVSSIDSNFEPSLKRTPPPNNNLVSWNGGNFIDNSEVIHKLSSQPLNDMENIESKS